WPVPAVGVVPVAVAMPVAGAEAATQAESGPEAATRAEPASAGATRHPHLLVPAQFPGDGLERGGEGRPVVGRHRTGDLRAHALDDLGEAVLGGAPLAGELPAVVVAGDPAALFEPAESLPATLQAGGEPGGVDLAGQHVQQHPVAARDVLAGEGFCELAGDESVDRAQPVAQRESTVAALGGRGEVFVRHERRPFVDIPCHIASTCTLT